MTTLTVSRAELERQGRDIVEAHGGKWVPGRGGMCRCPAHADNAPSLSVRPGDTALLLHCFAGCHSLDVLDALRRQGAPLQRCDRTDVPPATKRLSQRLLDNLWASSRSIAGTRAAAYLASRGLVSHSAQLRFHPRVQLGPTVSATYHPALLAAVRDDSGLIAIHRTFLDDAWPAKAAMDNPRRMLGTPGQGAVRLGQPGRVLGLAEGIETALAASLLHGFPVWAVLGNERFGMISIPAHVEGLVLLGDNDHGGRRAVELATAGLPRPGLAIETIWPPASHNDWADVLETTKWEGEGKE